MTTISHREDENLRSAFGALRELVTSWRSQGRITTTAGIKPALAATSPPVEHQALGFATFADFLHAAAAAGYISMYRQPNGHWLVLLADEEAPGDSSGSLEDTPLRPDVWRALVDWSDGLDRRWDRGSSNAILLPVDESGAPLWVSEPSRFVRIPQITQAEQIKWMHEFADDRPTDAAVLHGALAEDAPRGEWLRTLKKLNLVPQWRATLQARVKQTAQSWAKANGIGLASIFVPMSSSRRDLPEKSSPPAVSTLPDRARSLRTPLDALRSAVHAAIDEMSFEELASLQIRAVHLLRNGP